VSDDAMIEMTCLCGAVHVSAPRPQFVHQCNCTLCTKTGACWAYCDPLQVTVTGATRSAVRPDREAPNAEVHFCPGCGSTTHFRLTPAVVAQHGDTMMGVNMALADAADLTGVELRFPDGRGWDGASAFGYVQPATVIG
jgi:hypothetical protein